jgi:hypothetical protein
MEKNISYSLFGYEPKYYVGAEKNIEINKTLLPDWNTIIYYHPQMFLDEYLDKLSNIGAKMVDVSDVKLGEKTSVQFPFFWRFLSFLDDGLTISRDLDSRLSEREVVYIKKWEESNKDYFIIRDHPWHSPVPSGLFGIKNKIEEFETHFINFINTSGLGWGTDQEILHEYIQKIDNDKILYFGFDKKDTYIPRDDENFFIGIQLDEFDNPTKPSGELCLKYLKELNL